MAHRWSTSASWTMKKSPVRGPVSPPSAAAATAPVDTSSLEQMPTPSIASCRAEYEHVRRSRGARIAWGREPKFTPLDTPPDFTANDPAAAAGSLRFQLHALDKHARASTLYFPKRERINRKEPVGETTKTIESSLSASTATPLPH